MDEAYQEKLVAKVNLLQHEVGNGASLEDVKFFKVTYLDERWEMKGCGQLGNNGVFSWNQSKLCRKGSLRPLLGLLTLKVAKHRVERSTFSAPFLVA